VKYQLSILIPTIPERIEKLKRQLDKIPNEVQVIYLGDNKTISTGKKRNILLGLSEGLYSTFIDDDDLISDDFVSEILKAIKENDVDVICYEVGITFNGETYRTVLYSKDYINQNKGSLYLRRPNHLMVWRTEKAKEVPFLDVTVGEDTIWANQMVRRIDTQYIINKRLYKYYAIEGRHNGSNS